MKRQGFYMPSVAVFTLVAMSVLGFLMERHSAKLLLAAGAIRDGASASEARRGVRLAEDWLISSVISGGLPHAGSAYIQNPFERIEALGSGGSPVMRDAYDLPRGTTLSVSDLDYTPGLFTEELANKIDTPFVPRLPRIETDSSERAFYFIRCTVPVGDASHPGKISAAELIAVSMDKVSGAVFAERIFYRNEGD